MKFILVFKVKIILITNIMIPLLPVIQFKQSDKDFKDKQLFIIIYGREEGPFLHHIYAMHRI